MAVKCKITMGDRVAPVAGSVVGVSGKETGTCPECLTPGVMLSIVGGFVRAHVVADREVPENNPQAPTLVVKSGKKVGTGLSEPMVELTDTGVRVGDPRLAEQRRLVEIEGANGTGMVKVPRKVPGTGVTKSGAPRMTTKLVEVEATEAHVREALEYWKGRTPRTDASRKAQSENVSQLVRRLEAMRRGSAVLDAAMVDACQAHRGPTLVPGRDVAPRLRDPELPFEVATDLRADGSVRKMTTLDQPRGRDRFDRKITDVPEPAPVLSRSQKRNARRKRCQAAYVERMVSTARG